MKLLGFLVVLLLLSACKHGSETIPKDSSPMSSESLVKEFELVGVRDFDDKVAFYFKEVPNASQGKWELKVEDKTTKSVQNIDFKMQTKGGFLIISVLKKESKELENLKDQKLSLTSGSKYLSFKNKTLGISAHLSIPEVQAIGGDCNNPAGCPML